MKRNREEEKKIHGNTKPCCFFKLILSPSSQSKKLGIPELFVRTFCKELSTTSILTVPTGKTHKVALFEEDNKLWFHDGWHEFVDYFSIGNAFFLQFKYEGNSQFSVHIFDPTACEISYQCNARNDLLQHEPCSEDNVDADDEKDKIKILHSSSINLKISGKEAVQLDSDDEEINDAKEGASFRYPYEPGALERMMNAAVAAGISSQDLSLSLLSSHILCIDEGTWTFLHFNKMQFVFLQNVPISFDRDHLRCMEIKSKFMMLEACGGRQWTVKCMGDRRKCTFGTGWIVFARDVGLGIGDVCVFELTDAKSYELNVHVAKKSLIKAAPRQIFESI